jgi:ferrous iron transport protein B
VDVTPTPEQIAALQAAGESVQNWQAQQELAGSIAGRLGHAIEPIIAPLGFDWRIGVGVIASFAAREVVVSALSVIFGVGDAGAGGGSLLIGRLHAATYADGTPVFTFATCASLLVFYILAMQCLPTLAVTRREAGGWKWAGFQFAYMSVLAYTVALITYQGLHLFGVS